MLKRLTIAAAAAVILSIGGATGESQAQSGKKGLVDVTFSLDFITLGRHAPWYVALAKGFYEDEGLNVKIIPGKGSAQVMQAVESGIADIGFVDVPGLVLGRAAGSTIKLVAVNYQKVPYAVFSLDPGANVTRPEQLEGLSIGSGAGSFTPKVFAAFMRSKGLDPDKLKIINVAPPARAAMLLSGKIEAIEFFIMARAGLSRATGKKKLKTMLFGDHGLKLYSNSIGAKQSYIKKNPKIVRGFVKGALRGWQYTLRNPAEAADLQLKYAKALKRQIIIDEIAILRNLAVTPDTEANGLGWFSPAQMKESRDFMIENVGVKGTPPRAEDLYVTGFLPATPIKP